MGLIRLVTRPVKNLTDAIFVPFKAVFVVGLCALVNWMTFDGEWWVQWVAFGMGIAVVVAFARAAKTLLLLGLVAWGGRWIYRRYGEAARHNFDEWVARTLPQAHQVAQALRGTAAQAPHRAG